MQESELENKREKKPIVPVWDDYDEENGIYVHRCSRCGRSPKVLKEHWFFTGVYCLRCILGVFYDDTKSLKEIGL